MGSLNISLGSNDITQERGFKYRDFDIRFVVGNKDYNTHDDLDAVFQGLRNIFGWNKGERIILPEFGNNIRSFLYEPINDKTINDISRDLKNTIERWEPRVLITTVNARRDPEDEHTLVVELIFTVPTLSNDEFVFEEFITGEAGAI
tara:strand:+ start:72 stop:512 length:441 start_codon:yes stop_codon:yes gene_type:complete